MTWFNQVIVINAFSTKGTECFEYVYHWVEAVYLSTSMVLLNQNNSDHQTYAHLVSISGYLIKNTFHFIVDLLLRPSMTPYLNFS